MVVDVVVQPAQDVPLALLSSAQTLTRQARRSGKARWHRCRLLQPAGPAAPRGSRLRRQTCRLGYVPHVEAGKVNFLQQVPQQRFIAALVQFVLQPAEVGVVLGILVAYGRGENRRACR